MEKLVALKPDLVLGLQTAHNQFKLKLESEGIRVILVNPITVDEAITDIARLGAMLGVHRPSEILVELLLNTLDEK